MTTNQNKTHGVLKPCPFCGCAPDLLVEPLFADGAKWIINCPDCPARMVFHSAPTVEAAIDRWNDRRFGDMAKAAPQSPVAPADERAFPVAPVCSVCSTLIGSAPTASATDVEEQTLIQQIKQSALDCMPGQESKVLRSIVGQCCKLQEMRGYATRPDLNCDKAPEGLACSRGWGHGGPCAAAPTPPTSAADAVAAEYNEWIRYHAAGTGDFDDFLQMVNERAAIAASQSEKSQ